ncbi:protein-L-isoaspartate O-methyltransferase family protein [Acetobacter estunensis]|nr:protein-L-isoaspartate O-methyltransferase [Acetobacter estunensis]
MPQTNSLSVPTSADFAEARQIMVDDQIRPVEVNDPRIVAAMRELPRELAVPEDQRRFAYADRSLPLGNGRFLLQPMVLARLTQMAHIEPGERVLIVGAGMGYLASLVAALEAQVTALESDPLLAAAGQLYTAHAAPAVAWRQGSLTEGAPGEAPFDLIFFEGAVPDIPAFCAAQLAPQGRVAGVLQPEDGTSSAFLAHHDKEDGWAIRRFFDAAAPVLPAFAPAPAFVF